MIDDRTANLDLPKPHADNVLTDDVARLRSALDGIDTAIAGKLPAASVTEFGGTLIDDADAAAARATLGLSNVENKSSATIRGEITSGNVTAALAFTPENSSNKGAASGYAPLDGSSKVPPAYLPSYVDDVLEYADLAAFPVTGESGKLYVALDNGKTYRWSGSAYVLIIASPGTTDAVTEGATNLYHTAQRVRDVVLTGLSTATNAVIAAGDSVLGALGKLQAQLSAHFGAGGAAHADATTGAAGFMSAADKTKLNGAATLAGAEVFTNKTLTGYTETVYAVTGTTPSLNPANGTIQTWTLTANSTPTAASFDAGQSMTLMIDDGTFYTVTWPTITWVNGSAPTLKTTGYTVVVLWKVGSVLYGRY